MITLTYNRISCLGTRKKLTDALAQLREGITHVKGSQTSDVTKFLVGNGTKIPIHSLLNERQVASLCRAQSRKNLRT